jgi:hypothetical protein
MSPARVKPAEQQSAEPSLEQQKVGFRPLISSAISAGATTAAKPNDGINSLAL